VPRSGRILVNTFRDIVITAPRGTVAPMKWGGALPTRAKVVACMPLPRGLYSLELKLANDARTTVQHGEYVNPGRFVLADLKDGLWAVVGEAA
jgi:hypothetical protein